MRRVASVLLPALLFAAVLVFVGCADEASAGQDYESWEVASWDALMLDEVVVRASRRGDIETVVVQAERPEMMLDEVVSFAEQPEGLPVPPEVSAMEPGAFRHPPDVN